MNAPKTLSLLLTGSILISTGCVHRVEKAQGASPVTAQIVSMNPATHRSNKTVPVLSATSARAAEAPRKYAPDAGPVPILLNPVVEEWEMSAHVNENGEFVGPSSKYVIKTPMRWNPEAMNNPNRLYVPPENLAPVPGSSSVTHYSITDSKQSVKSAGPAWITSDSANVRVTGIVERSKKDLAQKMCGEDEVVIWDDATGYLIVPKAALTNEGINVKGERGLRAGTGRQQAAPQGGDDEL